MKPNREVCKKCVGRKSKIKWFNVDDRHFNEGLCPLFEGKIMPLIFAGKCYYSLEHILVEE